MADYIIAAVDRGSYENELAAGVEDKVTFEEVLRDIEIRVHTGTSLVYFTVDGSQATVKGAHCFSSVAAGESAVVGTTDYRQPGAANTTVIRLVSTGVCVYSVNEV